MTATKYHDPAETTPGLGVVGPARPTTRPGRRTLPLSEWERANRLGLLVVCLKGPALGGLARRAFREDRQRVVTGVDQRQIRRGH